MGREEAGKSNAIATPKRQKSWKHRKHLEKRRFSIFMGLLSPICCVWSGSFIQRIVFHQCYAGNSFHPFGQYKRSVCRSICRNKSINLTNKGWFSTPGSVADAESQPFIVHQRTPQSPCGARHRCNWGMFISRWWLECWASLYISQPFGGFRHERSHVLCLNVACV